jgi:hypothetical protein
MAGARREGDPDAFVRKVTYHRAMGCLAAQGLRPEVRSGDAGDRPELRSRGDDTDTVVHRLVLREALSRLTPRQRAVLVLRFYEDCTEAQAHTSGRGIAVSPTEQAAANLSTLRAAWSRELAGALGDDLADMRKCNELLSDLERHFIEA